MGKSLSLAIELLLNRQLLAVQKRPYRGQDCTRSVIHHSNFLRGTILFVLKTYPINDLLLINQHIINFVFIADNFSAMCMLFCSYIRGAIDKFAELLYN